MGKGLMWVLGFCALAVIPAAFLPWRPAAAGDQTADGGADSEPGSPHRRSFLAPARRVATIGRVASAPQDPVPPDPGRARSRRRRRSRRASVPTAWTGPPADHRLLLLASDPVDGRRLTRLLDRDRDKSTAVLVVAPALHRTRLRYWVSDSDEAIEHARGVQREIVDALRREHVPSGGHVGAADPLVAIEDALRFFDADRIAIALHKRGRRRYRECDLRAEVERRFRRPVIAVEPQPA